jgi:hypothetical protein
MQYLVPVHEGSCSTWSQYLVPVREGSCSTFCAFLHLDRLFLHAVAPPVTMKGFHPLLVPPMTSNAAVHAAPPVLDSLQWFRLQKLLILIMFIFKCCNHAGHATPLNRCMRVRGQGTLGVVCFRTGL